MPQIPGKVVILVDELAAGSRCARLPRPSGRSGPARIVVAVPAAPESACREPGGGDLDPAFNARYPDLPEARNFHEHCPETASSDSLDRRPGVSQPISGGAGRTSGWRRGYRAPECPGTPAQRAGRPARVPGWGHVAVPATAAHFP
jgi:hypothetical protein